MSAPILGGVQDPATLSWKIRTVQAVLPALAANASSGKTNLVTFDDPKPRRLTGIYVTAQVKLLVVELDVAGRVFVDLDCSMFAAARGFVELDQLFATTQLLSFNMISKGASGVIVAATDSIVLRYEAAPDQIPIPGP